MPLSWAFLLTISLKKNFFVYKFYEDEIWFIYINLYFYIDLNTKNVNKKP